MGSNANHKAARRRKREQGICVQCPALAIAGKSLCDRCRILAGERDQRYRQRVGPRAGVAGQCTRCEQPSRPGRRQCEACARRNVAYQKEYAKKQRTRVLEHYGGRCVRCGENRCECLRFHHTNHDGGEQRRNVPLQHNFPYYAETHGYPVDIELLCANCHKAEHAAQ
jgi:hypothetical protein